MEKSNYLNGARVFIVAALLTVMVFLHAQTFPCDNGMRLYFFQAVGANGSLSYITNYTATPVVTTMFPMSTSQHNALAANPVDSYLYFLQGTNLVKLDAVGGTTTVCNIGFSSAYGCFDNLGRFWTVNGSSIVAIDINTNQVVKGPYPLSSSGFIDIVYNIFNSHIYTEASEIDTNGVVVSNTIVNFTPAGTWGGVGMGLNGFIYGISGSSANGILSGINVSNNTTFSISNVVPGPTAGQSDMASFMCSANSVTSICLGAVATISIGNPFSLSNPNYSIQPNGQTQANPVFTVSPSISTNYSLFATGTNSANNTVTYSVISTVNVNPIPVISPTLTNGTCANPVTSSVNLNVTFNPSGSPNYTVNWSPLPGTITAVNSGTASGLVPGVNNVTVTTQNGCVASASFSVPPIPLPADFIIVNPGGSYTVTCNYPNVLLTTSVTNGNVLTYTWFPSCSGTVTGSSMNFNQACTGQVVGTSSTGCIMSQSFTIYQDLTSPTIAVTPTVINITCGVSPSTFTGTSNLGPNVTTNWFQIVGSNTVYVGAAGGTVNIFSPGQPGVYWFESVNNLTGCKKTMSVQVTASVGVPIFTVTSTSNFTIGCASTSVTSMQVSTVITSPVLNVAVNYTFVPPSAASSTPTTWTVNPNLNNITIPGTYVVYVKDLTNNCVSSMSISIIQNTIAPNVDFIQPLIQLSCKDPSMVLSGISSNTNTVITWTVPAAPSNSVDPTPNATVIINPAATGATNNVTAVGIYTVGAVDNNNQCRATKTVQINQDVRLPKFTISALTNSIINCKNPDVLIVPIVTPTLAVALVPTYIWYPPVGPGVPGTQFNTTSPGTHTAVSTSAINGCTYSATYNVATDLAPPAIQVSDNFTLDCATDPTVSLFPTITGTTTGFTYSWTVPAGALTSNLTSSLLVTDKVGNYFVIVTNTINGCLDQGEYEVIAGKINADFIANPDYGFAPLAVTFNNTSSTSTGASSIISTWGYGNGAITQTVYNTSPTSATYTSSGTYSVILKAQKGTCVDTAMKIITVELPSKLEIPNIFTPNGDKANDIFRLKATNLSSIYIIIFDRWGTKVYELTSETGNFAWDGKNQLGKDCADGTYFYIIKATGKDGQTYDLKGNVSLFR